MTQSRRGGILFGLLLSALVLVCLTIAAGLWIARNVSVSAERSARGENVSIRTPAGDLSVRGGHELPDPASLGVPVYPGAQRAVHNRHGGGAVVEWNSRDDTNDGGFSIAAIELVTPDPVDKVFSWYRERLPDFVEKQTGTGRELHDKADKLHIGIAEKADGTHIGIAQVGEPPAN